MERFLFSQEPFKIFPTYSHVKICTPTLAPLYSQGHGLDKCTYTLKEDIQYT